MGRILEERLLPFVISASGECALADTTGYPLRHLRLVFKLFCFVSFSDVPVAVTVAIAFRY